MTTKFCVDCKHHTYGLGVQDLPDACHAPQLVRMPNPVTGEAITQAPCDFMRCAAELCGVQGVWFEPKDETK